MVTIETGPILQMYGGGLGGWFYRLSAHLGKSLPSNNHFVHMNLLFEKKGVWLHGRIQLAGRVS